MLLVVTFLEAAPGKYVNFDCTFNRLCFYVGIEDDFTIDISGSSSDGLNEAAFITQKTLFIRVEDEYGCDFRYV